MLYATLGFFLPFAAIYGGYGLFNALRRLTPDISIPSIAAFNMVLVNTVFPWLVIDDFVGAEASSTLFHAMLVGTLIVAAIIAVKPGKFAKVTVCPANTED